MAAATRAFLNCRQRATDEHADANATDSERSHRRHCHRRLAGFQVSDRLRDCAAKLREHVRGPLVSRWLKDNHSLLQSQIADLRHTLRPSLLRKLPNRRAGEPRIHQIAAGWLAEIAAEWLATAPGVVDSDVLMPFAEALRETAVSRDG